MAASNEALAWRALALLELRLSTYRYAPGARLSADRLSEETRIGRTPMRAALQWLYRDGVIGHEARSGYFVKSPSESDYRSLYAGSRALLIGSLDAAPIAESGWTTGADESGEKQINSRAYSAEVEATFLRISEMSGSDVVVHAVDIVNVRLRFVRTIEPALIKTSPDEISRIAQLLADGDLARLKRAIDAYHRRRLAMAGALADAASAKALRGGL